MIQHSRRLPGRTCPVDSFANKKRYPRANKGLGRSRLPKRKMSRLPAYQLPSEGREDWVSSEIGQTGPVISCRGGVPRKTNTKRGALKKKTSQPSIFEVPFSRLKETGYQAAHKTARCPSHPVLFEGKTRGGASILRLRAWWNPQRKVPD